LRQSVHHGPSIVQRLFVIGSSTTLLAHAMQPLRRTLVGHFDSFSSKSGSQGGLWTPPLKLAFSHLANSSTNSSLKSHRCAGPVFSDVAAHEMAHYQELGAGCDDKQPQKLMRRH
jgi:hypothetical protein